MNTISRVQELADERGLTLCQLSKICDLSEATIRTAKKRGNQLSVIPFAKPPSVTASDARNSFPIACPKVSLSP